MVGPERFEHDADVRPFRQDKIVYIGPEGVTDANGQPLTSHLSWTNIPIGPEGVVGRYLFRVTSPWTWPWLKLKVGALVCRVVGHRMDAPGPSGCPRCHVRAPRLDEQPGDVRVVAVAAKLGIADLGDAVQVLLLRRMDAEHRSADLARPVLALRVGPKLAERVANQRCRQWVDQ